jgi:4-hydroxy-3-methylbut-2-enyl diphosphate reductase
MTFQVELAEESGFCFGVRRALELARQTARNHGVVYSLGPLIHNPQEVEQLARSGVRVVQSLAEVPPGGTLIIRSHGAPPEVVEQAVKSGLTVVDATCPLVTRAQERARELAEAGYKVVVAGEADHPEVQAIVAHAAGAVVVEDGGDLSLLGTARRIGVVAQTTQSPQAYRQLIGRLLELEPAELRVYNTICTATLRRQKAALELAGRVDVMMVVGGKNSANTRRLAELCTATGVPTYHIETAAELDDEWFREARSVGVTAGASTPDWVIREVVEALGK